MQFPSPDRTFKLVLARSGRSFDIPPGDTMLAVLRRNGVDVPYTCELGTCGSCVVPVLEGAPEHRDKVLSDELKAGNRLVALCVSRARTAKLVIDC